MRSTWRFRAGGSVAAAAAVGFLSAMGAVWQTSRVAFLGSVDNGGNAWSVGTVSLDTGGSGASRFTADGLKPGDAPAACVTVSYRGSLDAAVRLYVRPGAASGTLNPYLQVTVEQGGPAASCDAISHPVTLYTGTLAGLAQDATNYASGVGSWAPGGASNASTEYRFTWSVSDDNAAQGRAAAATFTWEARSL